MAVPLKSSLHTSSRPAGAGLWAGAAGTLVAVAVGVGGIGVAVGMGVGEIGVAVGIGVGGTGVAVGIGVGVGGIGLHGTVSLSPLSTTW